nr:unnamed protein product [Callosobruchus chinensis]
MDAEDMQIALTKYRKKLLLKSMIILGVFLDDVLTILEAIINKSELLNVTKMYLAKYGPEQEKLYEDGG